MKPLKFAISVTTHWNSLVICGSHFRRLLPGTIKAFKHKNIKSNVLWSENDTLVLNETVKILELARIATESLSRSTMNTLKGERIMKFLLNEIKRLKLENKISTLVKSFSDAIEKRVENRRKNDQRCQKKTERVLFFEKLLH